MFLFKIGIGFISLSLPYHKNAGLRPRVQRLLGPSIVSFRCGGLVGSADGPTTGMEPKPEPTDTNRDGEDAAAPTRTDDVGRAPKATSCFCPACKNKTKN